MRGVQRGHDICGVQARVLGQRAGHHLGTIMNALWLRYAQVLTGCDQIDKVMNTPHANR